VLVANCFAILASLCINQSATAEVEASGGLSGARIQIGQVSIDSIIRSDSILRPHVSQMREACNRSSCIDYRGHCSVLGGRRRCTLWYAPRRSDALRRIEITGEGRAVAAVMSSVRLMEGNRFSMLLSEFRYDAQNDLPPICQPRSICSNN
jgi:hypothetical protein